MVDRMQATSPAGSPCANGPALPIPWWPKVVVILGALLTLLGGVLALVHPETMLSPHEEITNAVRTYAGYLAARNTAIALLLLALLSARAWRALSQLMILVAFIQFFDACMDGIEARWPIVPGVLLIGIVFLFAARRLSGSPFWNMSAWK